MYDPLLERILKKESEGIDWGLQMLNLISFCNTFF